MIELTMRNGPSAMKPFRLIPLLIIACLSCARTSPPPSRAELREYGRLEANEAHAIKRLESGAIYAGQDVQEFLRLCTPYRADFVERYIFIEFYPVPNLRGLSLIAIEGKLVSARRWSCQTNDAVFETIGEDDRLAAYAAYEPRMFRR